MLFANKRNVPWEHKFEESQAESQEWIYRQIKEQISALSRDNQELPERKKEKKKFQWPNYSACVDL